jgi:hypothetical protein
MGSPILFLFILLPLLAVLWEGGIAASAAAILWLGAVLPAALLKGLDFFRTHRASGRHPLLILLLRLPVGVFGFLSLALGAAPAAWVLYNTFVERQPEYIEPPPFRSFTLAALLAGFGVTLLRLSARGSRGGEGP